MELHLSTRGEIYTDIIRRTQRGQRFLDVGCCLGQDVRKLVHDGAPSQNVAGLDLNQQFLDLGHQLFRDADSDLTFMQADILDGGDGGDGGDGSRWACERGMREAIDVIHLGMLLHMFNWEQQVQAFRNIIRMSNPVKGSLILGEAAGHVEGIPVRATWGGDTMRHNADSFGELVRQVSAQTETGWALTCDLRRGSGRTSWNNPQMRRLIFLLERVI